MRRTQRIKSAAAILCGLWFIAAAHAVVADALPTPCAGDCSDDGAVSVDELITLVNLALGAADGPPCAPGDTNHDGAVSIDEILQAVRTALGGCPPAPWHPGPFGVGFQRMTFTKESVTEPGHQRVLDTWIWYPADPATASLRTNPRGKVGVPLAPGAGPFPLLAFSHGSCGMPAQSLFLTTVLASYGFVVAAPPHPGNVLSPTCETQAALDDAFVNRPADISFIIDALLGLGKTAGSFLQDAVDSARIGVLGHSFGGLTALRVSALDARIVAGLALAPATEPPWGGPSVDAEVRTIRIPMMIQGGDLDTLTPFEGTARHAYDLLHPPRYLLEIFGMGHFGFSDICVGPLCGASGTLTQDEAHRLILHYAVPFLLEWVADDHRFDAHLAPDAAPAAVILPADVGGS